MWHFIVFDVIFPIFLYICNSQNNFIFYVVILKKFAIYSQL